METFFKNKIKFYPILAFCRKCYDSYHPPEPCKGAELKIQEKMEKLQLSKNMTEKEVRRAYRCDHLTSWKVFDTETSPEYCENSFRKTIQLILRLRKYVILINIQMM